MNERQAVEYFHLAFLHTFGARVDRSLFALKGGCNLRFFWKSIRYSEDLDLDVRTMSVATLRNNVDRVLDGPALSQTLRSVGIGIEGGSAPKQTKTTQRWKLTLSLANVSRAIPTKIEFSRRRFDTDAEIAPVDPAIIRRHKSYPVLVQRYGLAAAFRQKVEALAGRPETQARDVFDIKLLLDQGAQPPAGIGKLVPRAVENAVAVGYDEFAGQVLAYLEPEYQDHYRGRAAWEALQDEVVRTLEELAP